MRVKYNKMMSEEREHMEINVREMERKMAEDFKKILHKEVERARREERDRLTEERFGVTQEEEVDFGFE